MYFDPTYEFTFNYNELAIFAENIKFNVSLYINNQDAVSVASLYSLKYNTVKDSNGNWVTSGGAWDEKWLNYNCYAYAIKRNEQPPYYSSSSFQYQPGDMSGSGSFADCNNINQLATIVKNDLEEMGYSNVSCTTYIPTISDNQELICVRMCDVDYHFMRYDLETNYWYHKPGQTAILRYNTVPNNSTEWKGEASIRGDEKKIYQNLFKQLSYDSDIYFIKYNKNKINVSSNTSNFSYDLNVNAGKDSILEIESFANTNYIFNIASTNSTKIEVYDNEMELLETHTGTNIQFCKNMLNETYYLKCNYVNTSSSGSVLININAHTHSYTNYRTYSATQHKAICSCGEYKLQYHIVNNEDMTRCVLCNGLVSSSGITPFSLIKNYITENGSYLLSNGIIVLVSIDYEDFISGELDVFNLIK